MLQPREKGVGVFGFFSFPSFFLFFFFKLIYKAKSAYGTNNMYCFLDEEK
jgi:hypothetical protein